ncbi:hypothetical protein QC761_302748 [Podospora bellae-mahoneyi]|uniref:Uncharacterized protein n=1 Tax=Podospora bellae-mahoneyi TaxID=2093777 RepID=A0ABR0FL68_9PEZI|nr:hypothetical protein QC761_302748 [Podospora bellae-mahoneyi]
MELVLAFDLTVGLRIGFLLVLKMVFDIRPLNTSVFAKPQDALPADTDALVFGQPHLFFQKCSDGVEDSETGTEQCIEGVNIEVNLRPSHSSLFVNLTSKSWGLIGWVRLLRHCLDILNSRAGQSKQIQNNFTERRTRKGSSYAEDISTSTYDSTKVSFQS